MLSFECDYNNGCLPEILQELQKQNDSREPGYGLDSFSEKARDSIRKAFSCPDADIFFLTGGTQTNSVVISSLLSGVLGVIAAESGHIATHEAGAVEYTGHKVLTLPGHDGKLDAAELSAYLKSFFQNPTCDHMVNPGLVYISFPTEYGTIYTKAELLALHSVCKEYDLPLFIDGARLGYGLMSKTCDIQPGEFASFCDVFYIGGTKVGALCGEAVVFPRGNAPKHFFSITKQHGALLAKGRLMGIQFQTLFADGLYFRAAGNAIEKAELLKAILHEKGYRFCPETATNQQFILLDDAKVRILAEAVRFDIWDKPDAAHTVIRFCTSWATTEAELLQLKALL